MATIYKRGQTYYARVTYRGKEYRRSLETTTARVAQHRLVTFISDVKNGKWGDKPRRTYEEAVERFVSGHFPRIKPNSRKRYGVSLLNLHDHFQGKYLDEIGSAAMSEFESERRAAGVTDSTIRRDLACLSGIFSYAEELEWLLGNPVGAYLKKAKRRGFVESEPRTRVLSNDEEARMFALIARKRAAAKGRRDIHGWQMQEAVFAFAIDTGLRDEEILTLEWRNVDLAAREVTVIAETAKNRKRRQVPIFERSLKLLEALPRSDHTALVFWYRDGQRYASMYRALQRICEALGLERCSFHDLRRTCGCRLLRDWGFSMEKVSAWLGHSSVQVTERVYAFLNVDALHRAVRDEKARRDGRT